MTVEMKELDQAFEAPGGGLVNEIPVVLVEPQERTEQSIREQANDEQDQGGAARVEPEAVPGQARPGRPLAGAKLR